MPGAQRRGASSGNDWIIGETYLFQYVNRGKRPFDATGVRCAFEISGLWVTQDLKGGDTESRPQRHRKQAACRFGFKGKKLRATPFPSLRILRDSDIDRERLAHIEAGPILAIHTIDARLVGRTLRLIADQVGGNQRGVRFEDGRVGRHQGQYRGSRSRVTAPKPGLSR